MSIAREARGQRWLGALVPVVMALAGCAPAAPNAGQPTIQGQSMARMRATVETIRDYTKGAASQPAAHQAAMELLAWSDRVGELFPPDTAPKLYVDMTAKMARAAPVAMHREAAALLAAVDSGNVAETSSALASTEKNGCGICHQTPYR